MEMPEVIQAIRELRNEKSIPKNVSYILDEIVALLADNSRELGVRVNCASQMIEDISLDPNLSSFARTQIWELSSILEGLIDDE